MRAGMAPEGVSGADPGLERGAVVGVIGYRAPDDEAVDGREVVGAKCREKRLMDCQARLAGERRAVLGQVIDRYGDIDAFRGVWRIAGRSRRRPCRARRGPRL